MVHNNWSDSTPYLVTCYWERVNISSQQFHCKQLLTDFCVSSGKFCSNLSLSCCEKPCAEATSSKEEEREGGGGYSLLLFSVLNSLLLSVWIYKLP